VRKCTNVNEQVALPEKNRGRTGKKALQICAEEQSQKTLTLVVGKNLNGKSQVRYKKGTP
jgi:hypothetical protein